MPHTVDEATEQSEANTPGRILLVDDQPELRRLFRRSLSRVGYSVVEASSGRVAVELLAEQEFDVVISDVHMPDMSGIELLEALHDHDPDLPVVLTSGSPNEVIPLETAELGAFAYLVKPVSFEMMHETASRAVDMRRARAAAKALYEPLMSMKRLRVPRPDDDNDD
jgi:DNA-binding NtrC family response regulator